MKLSSEDAKEILKFWVKSLDSERITHKLRTWERTDDGIYVNIRCKSLSSGDRFTRQQTLSKQMMRKIKEDYDAR